MLSLPQYRCMFKSMVFDGEFAYKNSINNDRVCIKTRLAFKT